MPKIAVPLLLASLACVCSAQQTVSTTAVPRDVSLTTPTTVVSQNGLTAFESKALLAFSPSGTAPTITLTGTVDRKAGSLKESGSITLKSNGSGLETEDWTLSSGERVFSKTAFTGTRSCSGQVAGKALAAQMDQGCSRIVPWFAPWSALSEIKSEDASATVITTPKDTSGGLIRLRFVPSFGDLSKVSTKGLQSIAALMQAAAVDVLFDATTALPQRVEYRQETTGDPAAAIEIAAVFSDFRLDAGFMLPHHIQRYIQRTLEADIHITNVTTE